MDKLLTPKEFAERIGVSETQLANQRYRRQGCPFVKIGHRTVRYRESDITTYEASCVVQTTNEVAA